MFDLYFYLMIKYFFEFHNNTLVNNKKLLYKSRSLFDRKKTNEAKILINNKKEQLDNYAHTGFLLYLNQYVKYF